MILWVADMLWHGHDATHVCHCSRCRAEAPTVSLFQLTSLHEHAEAVARVRPPAGRRQLCMSTADFKLSSADLKLSSPNQLQLRSALAHMHCVFAECTVSKVSGQPAFKVCLLLS